MDSALYVSMNVLDIVDCNMPYVCENASMSVYPHACDNMLHDFLGIVTSNSCRKRFKKFYENLSKFICKNDDLIDKLNESNKLVEKYKNLAEHSLEKLNEFKCGFGY